MKKILGKVLLSLVLSGISGGVGAQIQANGCGPGGQITSSAEGMAGFCFYTDGSCLTHQPWLLPPTCHWKTNQPSPPPQPDQFGAVAWNVETGGYNTSLNEPSRAEAERVALQKCGAGCKVYTWYKNQCVAAAVGRLPEGYLIRKMKLDLQRSRAEQKALSACREELKDCQLVFSECSL